MFRFSDIDTLHAWTHAPEREELLTKLQPYLAAEDEVTATRDRHLPDSFSDLLVRCCWAPGTIVRSCPPEVYGGLRVCNALYTVEINC